ncbi:ribosomal protein S18-alanine N-acetyltransferase [Demequina aurantiaca]|uniref:ribosomal protein S18-alanine N-acetyltransferase n=1 Tax=Demequina aurantiaca TaxID=676200 RepID=UPI003D3491EB
MSAPAAADGPPPARILRDMSDGDLAWMAEREREIFGAAAWSLDLIQDDFRYGGRRYRVLEVDDSPAAYAVYGYDGDAFFLMNIAVMPSARGTGLGRVLMEDFLSEARAERAHQAWLEVAVTNIPALALYRSYGFEDVRVRPRYYQPEDVDAIVMRVSVPRVDVRAVGTTPVGV